MSALTDKLLSNPSKDLFRTLLDMTRPFLSADAACAPIFNPMAPSIATTSLAMKDKMAEFSKLCLNKVFVRLLSVGKEAAEVVFIMAKEALSRFEVVAERDMPDEILVKLLDCLMVWRAFVGLMDTTVEFLATVENSMYEEAIDNMMKQASQTRSRNVQSVVGLVMAQNEFWSPMIDNFTQTRAKTKEYAPSIMKLEKKVSNGFMLEATALIPILHEGCKNLLVWQKCVRDGTLDNLKSRS